MEIYIFFFTLLLLALFPKPEAKSNGYLLFFVTFVFILIGFRGLSVGIDTLSYVEDFQRYCRMSWPQAYADALEQREPLYSIVVGLLSRITDSNVAFLSFWAFFPSIALYFVFKNELKCQKISIAIAFLVLFDFEIITFFMAGIRQTVAMSILLIAYKYLKNINYNGLFLFIKDINLYKFLISLFIAFLFHNTAIFFILALLVRNIKVRWWFILIPALLFPLSEMIQIDTLTQAITLLFHDQYDQYGNSYQSELSMTGFFIQLIVFLICFISKSKVVKQDSRDQSLYNFALVGLVFQSLTGIIGEMYRLSFYFCIYSMILLPKALLLYPNKTAKNISIVGFVTGSLVYLFFISSSHLTKYVFF